MIIKLAGFRNFMNKGIQGLAKIDTGNRINPMIAVAKKLPITQTVEESANTAEALKGLLAKGEYKTMSFQDAFMAGKK